MLNSLYIFILRLNSKQVSEGQFWLAFGEIVATIAIIAIIRNT